MSARAETAAQRQKILAGLTQRNRLVAILRIGVPALGALVLASLLLQILLASIGRDFGISRVSFIGDKVVVDTPTYSGVTADGNIYRISAQAAQTAITNLNIIELSNATMGVTRPDGSQITAHMPTAAFETTGQRLSIGGTLDFSDSAGANGTLKAVDFVLPTQTLTGKGATAIRFANGATLDAASVNYQAASGHWVFGKATLTLPSLPDDAGP